MPDPFPLLATLPWALSWLLLLPLRRRRPDVGTAPRVSGRPLTVVVPARNEAENIGAILQSLRRSTYHPLEIIVVDDRSTDGTAAVAQAAAAGDERVQVLHGEELPAGWFGKPWACLQGYRAARHELVLFTDADTRHDPSLLEYAVGALEAEHADLVSIVPDQQCVTFWERLVMPQILVPLAIRYHPRRVNRARRLRDVIASGQFMLVTRAAYERAGTHAAVRGEVAEDLVLAQEFFKRGLRLHFCYAHRLIHTRMYTGLAHLVEGWSKNMFLGGRASFPDQPVLGAMMPAMFLAAVIYWLIPPVWLAIAGLTPGPVAAYAAAAVFWGLAALGLQIPVWYGLLYPLGTLVALWILVRSVWRGRRKVEWRGRVYRVARG